MTERTAATIARIANNSILGGLYEFTYDGAHTAGKPDARIWRFDRINNELIEGLSGDARFVWKWFSSLKRAFESNAFTAKVGRAWLPY